MLADGREATPAKDPTRLEWTNTSVSGTKGYIRGDMACADSIFEVNIDWRIVPHRISDSSFEQIIAHDELTSVVIPLNMMEMVRGHTMFSRRAT